MVSTHAPSRTAALSRHLHQMAVFVQVVDSGSFSKAATSLGLGKSVVSAHVAALESKLGTQLIARSTRSLTLTEDGAAFYEGCRQMVLSAENALATIESRREAVSGTIRMTTSYNLGVNFVIPQLAAFRERYPEIQFDLVLEDSVSRVIEERFDIALRVGRLADSGLFATELTRCRLVVCAAPSLLKGLPQITEPAQLCALPWVAITQLPHYERVDLVHRDSAERLSVRLAIAVRATSGIAAREFIRRGAGIGLLPDYAVRDDLAGGHLVEVLPHWRELEERPITAVFPSREGMSMRVRLLVDFLRAAFAPVPTRSDALVGPNVLWRS